MGWRRTAAAVQSRPPRKRDGLVQKIRFASFDTIRSWISAPRSGANRLRQAIGLSSSCLGKTVQTYVPKEYISRSGNAEPHAVIEPNHSEARQMTKNLLGR